MRKSYAAFLAILLVFAVVVVVVTREIALAGLEIQLALLDPAFRLCTQISETLGEQALHVAHLGVVAIFAFIPVLMVSHSIATYLKTRRRIGSALGSRLPHPKRLKDILVKRRIPSWRVCYVNSAEFMVFCWGFIRPRIVISRGAARRFNSKELEAVILHELCHLHAKDTVRIFFADLFAASVPMLPFVRELALRLRNLMEQEADAFTIAQQHTSKFLKGALAQSLQVAPEKYAGLPTFTSTYATLRLSNIVGNRLEARRARSLIVIRSMATLLFSSVIIGFLVYPTHALDKIADNRGMIKPTQCDVEHTQLETQRTNFGGK